MAGELLTDDDVFGAPALLSDDDVFGTRQPLPAGVAPSTAGAGRGGQGGPTAEELRQSRARRGTSRGVAPYVAPDEAPAAKPTTVLDQPYTGPLTATYTDAEMGSLAAQEKSPMARERDIKLGNYVSGKGAGVLAAAAEPSVIDSMIASTRAKPLDNSLGSALLESAGDAATILNDGRLSLNAGLFQVVQSGANAMRLLTGDAGEALQPLAQWADAAGTLSKRATSPELQQQAAELSAIIADEGASPATVLGYLMMHPKLLAMQAVESTPSMLGAAAGGRALGSLVERLSLGALSNAPATAAVAERIAELSSKGARIGAVGSEAMMGAAGVYDDVLKQGGSIAQAATAAGLAAIGYGVVGRFTGGGAEGALAAGRKQGVLKTMAAEGLEEGGQSLSESAGKAWGTGKELDIMAALRQATSEAAVGAVVGGATDVSMATPKPRTGAQQVADAIDQQVGNTYFTKSGIDGFARAAITPGSVLTDPNAVRPEDTRRPVIRAEDMPTTPLTPEQVAELRATAPVVLTDAEVMTDAPAAQGSTTEGERYGQERSRQEWLLKQQAQPPDQVGVAAVQQGTLATAAEQRLRENAQGNQDVEGNQAAQPAAAAVPARAEGGDGAATGAGAVEPIRQTQLQRYEASATAARSRVDSLRAAGLKPETSKDLSQAELDLRAAEFNRDTWANMQPPEDGPELQSFNAVATELRRVFGRPIIPYVDKRGSTASDGFAHDGKVFINLADPEQSVAFTVFHELQHVIRGEAKAGNAQSQLATRMLDQVWGMISTEAKQSYAKNYLFRAQMSAKSGAAAMTMEQALASPTLKDEMLSDFMGKRATDATFWRSLAAKEPTTFKAFVQRWAAAVKQLVANLRGMGRAGHKDIDRAIANLERAKLVAERVVREWAASNPQVQNEAASSTIEDDAGDRNEARATQEPATGAARQEPTISRSEREARPDGQGSARDGGLGPQEVRRQVARSYGSPRAGASSVVGYHYSRQPRGTLASDAYGSGLAGAEAERLVNADPRLRQRVYFYIDRGTGINPESGVGGVAHQVELRNLYDADEDALRLARDAKGGFTGFELAVINEGFDGYFTREAGPSGNAVLLGRHAVPVEQIGPRNKMAGERVPAAKPREKTAAELIGESRSLPAGRMEGVRWARIVAAVMPEQFAKVADSPVWASNDTMHRDELARKLLADGGIRYSRRDDELGSFSPFRDVVDDAPLDIDVGDLTEADIAALNEELNGELSAAPPGPQKLESPSDAVLQSVGIMAEAAYKPVEFKTNEWGTMSAGVTFTGQRSYHFSISPREDGTDLVDIDPPHLEGVGTALSYRRVSEQFGRDSSRRIAASIDLMRREFDLFTAVPAAARKRVMEAWQKVAKLKGAMEFGRARYDASAPAMARLQQVADSMLAGSRFSGKAMVGPSAGWYTLELTDQRGNYAGSAELQYVPGADRRFVLHTSSLDRGSGAGKAFYQVAFAFAHSLGVPVNADPAGLTGVNTYRRTEQMMSAAVRAGVAPDGIPGVGQRIYGWNKRAKDDTQRGRNLVRVALAAARNAAELVPEARDLTYDLATDSFGWRAKTKHSLPADQFVAQALKGADARAVSVSRSTLARAAITFGAIDGSLKIDDATEVASPVLYSARGDVTYAEVDAQLQPVSMRNLSGLRVRVPVDSGNGTREMVVDAEAAIKDYDRRAGSLRLLVKCLRG